MRDEITTIMTLVVAGGCFLRGAGVVLLAIRTFLQRNRFASVRIDKGFVLTAPEPFLMLVLSVWLGDRALAPTTAGAAGPAAAMAGVALLLVGWVMVLWTYVSWPSIFVGHALLPEHRLMTTGAYGFVRHPVYLGAFSIWLALGVAFASPVVLALTILYVIPAYLIYIRDEETMLAQAFGDAYRNYRRAVPMLIPRLMQRVEARATSAHGR